MISVQPYEALHGEIYEIPPTKMISNVERIQNQGMPEQIAVAKIKGTIKGGRSRKRGKDEVEEDLNMMRIKTQAGNGQIPVGNEEDCIGSQCSQCLRKIRRRRRRRRRRWLF
jgi:hypothetical protein